MILALVFSFAMAQSPDLNSQKGIRPDILNSSDDYLNARITKDQFYLYINKWNQVGWSEEEKNIVIDALQKGFDESNLKHQWLCNLKPQIFCDHKKYFSTFKWPDYLNDYETLIFAGQSYPRHQWNGLILNGQNRYIFISTRFSNIEFYGEAHNIIFPEQAPIQQIQQENSQEKSFYQKHKKKIWWTVGGILIVSGVFSLAGKKLVITQMGL